MTAWNHQKNADHLRRRAEAHIQQGRGENRSSPASMGHRPSSSVIRSADLRNDLTAAPYLSDLSGAFGPKK